MRILLSCLIGLFVVTDMFDIPLSLGPGLSAKNALLYILAGVLVLKFILQQRFKMELRAVHVCFGIFFAYSLLSMLAAALVIRYPGYSLLESAIRLKTIIFDQAIFFLVFFYGLRESRNAQAVLKILLIAVVIGNLIAVMNAWGIAQIGALGENEDERLNGLMGEPNQDAAYDALFIPILAAALLTSRGPLRVVWWLGGLSVSLMALLLTASRGGIVALLVACIWGVALFRRYFSMRRIVAVGAAGAALMVPVLAVVLAKYGELLYRRFIGDSTSSDMTGASSGRLEIWSRAIGMMADAPLTLITGFGWNSYWSLPTRVSPHNHYLALWFNTGLVGLACGTLLLVLVIREAIAAVKVAAPEYQPTLISFAIGAMGISIATFFVDLYTPWIWFWAVTGLAMRIAVNARRAAQGHVAASTAATPTKSSKDSFGWIATPQGSSR